MLIATIGTMTRITESSRGSGPNPSHTTKNGYKMIRGTAFIKTINGSKMVWAVSDAPSSQPKAKPITRPARYPTAKSSIVWLRFVHRIPVVIQFDSSDQIRDGLPKKKLSMRPDDDAHCHKPRNATTVATCAPGIQ